MSSPIEKELEILETIHSASDGEKTIVQRDIAHIVGVSIGMTNSIIKRLVKKGLLTIKKVNNRNINYAVSPAGMRALSEKSYRYFKRTIKNVVYYKEQIGAVLEQAKSSGYEKVALLGASDLDFIVEHFCFKYDLCFRRAQAGPAVNVKNGEYIVVSENISVPNGPVPDDAYNQNERFYLRKIVM